MSPSLPRRILAIIAIILGCVSIACLSARMIIGNSGILDLVNSDVLGPHVFCLDALSGQYPLSGWTLSSAPYLFPDEVLYYCLLLLCHDTSGITLPIYFAVISLTLVLLIGLCLKQITRATEPALIIGLGLGHLLLLLQFLPGHAEYVSWLATPVFHGGALVMGFAALWFTGGIVITGRSGSWLVPMGILYAAGIFSDSLFLIQFLLPIAVALYLFRRRSLAIQRALRHHLLLCLAAFLTSTGIRLTCALNGWFHFSRVFRYAPTPANQWKALVLFLGDFSNTLLPRGWAFIILALLAILALLIAARETWIKVARGRIRASFAGFRIRGQRHSQSDVNAARRSNQCFPERYNRRLEALAAEPILNFYRAFCMASLLIILPLPILACYWKDPENARYYLNWLVLPGFVLSLEAARYFMAGSRILWAEIVIIVVSSISIADFSRSANPRQFYFAYPPEVAQLDAFIKSNGLRYGLSGYWNVDFLNIYSHAGLQLRAIKADGSAYFWNNNAWEYFARSSNGAYQWPAYRFILEDYLDMKEVDDRAYLRLYGPPERKVSIASRYRVLMYSIDGQARIRAALEPEVRERLRLPPSPR